MSRCGVGLMWAKQHDWKNFEHKNDFSSIFFRFYRVPVMTCSSTVFLCITVFIVICICLAQSSVFAQTTRIQEIQDGGTEIQNEIQKIETKIPKIEPKIPQIGKIQKIQPKIQKIETKVQKIGTNIQKISPEVRKESEQNSISYRSPKWKWLQTDICDETVFVLLIVHSVPEHGKRRQLIRETWASRPILKRFGVRLLFTMGTRPALSINDTASASLLQRKIDQESSRYRDIIQQDFADTYRNLSHKAMMWLHWAGDYCSNASFVLKLDEDVHMNPFLFFPHLQQLQKRKVIGSNTIGCYVIHNASPMRNKKSKWYVSEKEFSQKKFEPYCMGLAYWMTADLMKPLAAASETTPFFWIDDYWITGKLAKIVGAKHYQSQSMFSHMVRGNTREEMTLLLDNYGVFAHMPRVSLLENYKLWKQIVSRYS